MHTEEQATGLAAGRVCSSLNRPLDIGLYQGARPSGGELFWHPHEATTKMVGSAEVACSWSTYT